jgi:hypothetical protein
MAGRLRGVLWLFTKVELPPHHACPQLNFQRVKWGCWAIQKLFIYTKGKLFATVPESSINSSMLWFIFNLRKINTH